MAVKISKVTEQAPNNAGGAWFRDHIAMSIASARRQVRREGGIILPGMTCTVKIVIEQEFDDAR